MERPVVFIAIAFSIGIAIGKFLGLPIWFTALVFSIFSALIFYAYFRRSNIFSLLLILFCLAGSLSYQIRGLMEKDIILPFAEKGYVTVIGQVDDAPRIKEDGISFPLKVEKIIKAKSPQTASGTVYVFVQDKESSLEYGDGVEVRGVIAQLQQFSNPLMLSGSARYRIFSAYGKKLSGGGGNFLKKIAIFFSQKFNEVLLKILPQEEASLLGSVLLGSAVSPLPEETKDTYRKAGLIHLLVVSGTQVSILIGVCLGITRSAGLPLWSSVLITSFFNLMLVVVTGAGPSILRAAIMGEITLIGLLFERQKEFYTSLALSAFILLLIDPNNLFDIGFQLSFAATWALVYIAPVLGKKVPSLLAISLAPILATSPIITFNFSQVSIGAIFSNLLVLPWVEFLVILGFSSTLLGFLFLPLAQILGGTIWLMLVGLDWGAKAIANFPGACFYIRSPTLPIIVGYYLGLIVFVELLRRERRLKITLRRLAVAFLLIVSVLVWNAAVSADAPWDKQLTVTFLEVGQGDSILLETPSGKKVLIDGGGIEGRGMMDEGRGTGDEGRDDPVGRRVVLPFLQKKGINRLDLVILTHPHADHIGGLNKVLEEIKVDQVLDSGQIYESQAYRRFKALIEANKIKYSIAQAGQTINFESGLRGFILNPSRPLLGDTNSDSIVMRLVFGDVSFLFAGDLEREGEERVLQSSVFGLQSSVLKVGHHGSSTSTTDEFLKAVNPRIAVISVGGHNRYRHPRRQTLEKLERRGVETYRTDQDGAVVVKTDGEEISINSYCAETTPVSHQ